MTTYYTAGLHVPRDQPCFHIAMLAIIEVERYHHAIDQSTLSALLGCALAGSCVALHIGAEYQCC